MIVISTLLAPVVCIILSVCVGRYHVPLPQVFASLSGDLGVDFNPTDDVARTIILNIRLPRALLGALVGGALAISGAAFQGLFRNPLVSSSILGVSSGAGFGAAMGILLFHSASAAYPLSLGFGIMAVFLSHIIGKIYHRTPTIMLVLGGVIVSAIFSSLISLVKYVADPYQELPAIVFWLMGSLATARYEDLLTAAPPILIGAIGLYCVRWRVNVLSMGEREAHALGIDTRLTKGIVIICASVATAGAVSVCGVIGWIGLIIPHIGRMIVGNDNTTLIPVSFSIGACFLVLIDIMGRIITGAEIPIGILTSLFGGPFFIYLLKTTKGRGW